MSDRVLLSASRTNAEDCIRLAVRHGLGVELMAFAYPDVLDGDWRAEMERYRALLKPVTGVLTLHGPFLDMSPASPDNQINEVCRGRFRHALRIAHELGGKIVILHANFIAAIRTESYRTGWHARSVTFWADIAEYAQQLGVTVAIENMWEFDPDIIGDVLKEIDHPYLRACIDIGHAHLYSEVTFTRWLDTLKPYLVHLHVNNNDGSMDFHGGLAGGFLDYPHLLGMVRALPNPPSITMEMDSIADMEASLGFFQLPQQTTE
ncbi:MAG: sugar phosphate isomerase/epimerase [Anaerolineae bacterium]|nr:sugar phosphate isomerase/epimerase [Anaerolineae bacterium]